tara:strand:+ start:1652 stop:2323 length:672 start_codon:yes stop_codon:yes gene_type:complete
MALYKVRGTLTGVTPIQLQNFKYQHPSEPLYKIRTPISQKRKKTEEDHITLSKLDFLMSCHWQIDNTDDCDCIVDSNGNVSFAGFKNPYMPAEMLRKSIRNSAKALNNRKGSAFDRGVTVTKDMLLNFKGEKDCNTMWNDKLYVRLRGERNGNLIWITRVKIPDWSVNFSLTCDTSQVELSELETMLTASGMYSGVGSYRPENGGNAGKFTVSNFAYEETVLI